MPTGWYIVQPPLSGTINPNLPKIKAGLVGQQLTAGPLAVVNKIARAQLNGIMLPEGPLNVSNKALSASLNGREEYLGVIGATNKPVSVAFIQDLMTGGMAAMVKPIIVDIRADAALGPMAATTRATMAALIGQQEQTGGLAAVIRRAEAAIAGIQTFSGALAAAMKKATALLKAPPSIIFSSHATVASTRSWATGTITAGLLQENDIIFIDIHSLQSTALTYAVPTDWNLALAMYDYKSSQPYTHVLWHRVTAAEVAANTTAWTLTNVLGTARTGRRLTYVVRGADPTNPVGASSANGATTNAVVIPGINPLGANSLIVAGWGGNSASTTTTYTLPTAPWSLVTGLNSSSNAVALVMQNANLSVVGTPIADINAAVNRSDDFSGYMMEIRAAA